MIEFGAGLMEIGLGIIMLSAGVTAIAGAFWVIVKVLEDL